VLNDVAHALANSVDGHDPEAPEQVVCDDEEKGDDKDEDEEEDNEFNACLELIWSKLLKVYLSTCQTLKLLTNIEVTENFFCTQELDDQPLASVVQDPFHSQPSPMDDAPRHINLLELHI
jgi:hypothetical protein